MHITSYQMHNVLNCYSKQLSQSRKQGKSAAVNRAGGLGELRPESEAKREATLAAISSNIYNKLTDAQALDHARQNAGAGRNSQTSGENRRGPADPQPTQFVFNIIDRLNRKITSRLSVEDSSGFVKRIEEMAHKAVDNHIESWV